MSHILTFVKHPRHQPMMQTRLRIIHAGTNIHLDKCKDRHAHFHSIFLLILRLPIKILCSKYLRTNKYMRLQIDSVVI